ncbi:hypothetical protein HY498_05020 [Candidatus Woesearchaeota archaeon]|nr:hypothetical protein [Candidatus Woesearchaeota archaeon]
MINIKRKFIVVSFLLLLIIIISFISVAQVEDNDKTPKLKNNLHKMKKLGDITSETPTNVEKNKIKSYLKTRFNQDIEVSHIRQYEDVVYAYTNLTVDGKGVKWIINIKDYNNVIQ